MYTSKVFTNSPGQELIKAMAILDNDQMDYPWTEKGLEEFLNSKKYRLYTIFNIDCLISFALFDEYDVNEFHLLKIVTHCDHLRRGLASSLLREVKKEASKIYLEVRQENQPAIELYLSQGFEYIRTLPRFYSDGEAARVYIYK